MTDLIIGMAQGYSDEQLDPFIKSLACAGYDGDVILLREQPIKWHPVVDRFEIIPRRIAENDYRYVIASDTRDVIFQSNPIEWLESNLRRHDIVVVGEEVTFADSPVNKQAMMDAFGMETYERMSSCEVLNCGVIAGRAASVADLSKNVYGLCLTDERLERFTPKWEDHLPDQTALALAIPYNSLVVHGADAFAFQYNHKHSFRDGEVFNENGQLYSIVHQYDYHWPELRAKYA